MRVTAITTWNDGHQHLDISTMKLAHAINNAWVFRLRRSQVPIHADVAVLGYPLGGRISYADGKVIARSRGHIALEIRSAPGESGGPVVDAQGRLVGVASLGNPSRGAFLIAYDISSRSAGWRRTLCRAYPHGGIQDCPGGGSASGRGTAPPPTPPPTTTAPAPVATPGHYCGFTNNGDALCFDITSGIPQTFTNLTFTVTYRGIECNPTATGTVNYTTGGAAVVQADNSFDFEVASGDQAGTFAKGTIMGNGTAAGTLNVHSVLSSGGTTYTCALTTDWTATKQ